MPNVTSRSSGYLKSNCNKCSQQIYMKKDNFGKWLPYESWIAGHCQEGEWVHHDCLHNGSTPPVPC